ncbi:MAG: hypothetical protein DRJ96_02315 [Thermoprotei archaeon]|nr:MAG: hypothetical protein DRJ96_02315 [Thermoprotei archaeon]
MPAIVREVVLENFMSYKYARIPLAPGVNIITGPNGSGKSSILLGMAVALGQTYTERGRRLSDLIRRGEEVARVTVVLDNRPVGGRRPLPWFRGDEVFFSRYLRSDGQYWHEVNGRLVSKTEVRRYLARVGLDPDNMLIIMHQNMVEEFAFLSPQERLRIVEAAVGLKGYRERIVSARRMLEEGAREAAKVEEALRKAREVLEYWSEVYGRYRRRRELEARMEFLKRELAWARVRDARLELEEAERELRRLEAELRSLEEELRALRVREDGLRKSVEGVEAKLLEGGMGVAEGLEELRRLWEELVDVVSAARVREFERSLLRGELEAVKAKVRKLGRKVRALAAKAEELGEEVSTSRAVEEVEEEIRALELELASLGGIPPNVEEAYAKYVEAYRELERRAEELEANRRRLMEELERRIALWRERVEAVIADVDEAYRRMLERLGARGGVRLVNASKVEEAGIELIVGFGGASPVPLDPYAHSGGERTAAIMCFFLALQAHVKSPLRAIDEFDVHMDPRNRDVVLEMIFEMAASDAGAQYVVITPGPLTHLPNGANVIVVQKVRGRSVALMTRHAPR